MGRSTPHPACYRFLVAGNCRCHGRDMAGGTKPVTAVFFLSGPLWSGCAFPWQTPLPFAQMHLPFHLQLLQRTEWFPVSHLCPLSSCLLPCLTSPTSIAAGCALQKRSGFGCIVPLPNSPEVTPLPYVVSSVWFCLWCSAGTSKGPVMMMGSLLDFFFFFKYSLHHYLYVNFEGKLAATVML